MRNELLFRTVDNVEIVPNLRIYGYDAQWGNVDPVQFTYSPNTILSPNSERFDGWFVVFLDDGSKALYNGERMITKTSLSTDPNPDRRLGKDREFECSRCLSVSMGTCMDADCDCHHS